MKPFVCVDVSPDDKPSYLMTEDGISVIAASIFDYYVELFASSPFSSAARFLRADFVRNSDDIANVVWCSRSYFVCQHSGKFYRVEGGGNRKAKEEVLKGRRLFYFSDATSEERSLPECNEDFAGEHDIFCKTYDSFAEDTGRKVFLSSLVSYPVKGVHEVFPIPSLREGDNVFPVFIPSEYTSDKAVLPYVIGQNRFLDPVGTVNGFITITNRRGYDLHYYGRTGIEFKSFDLSGLNDMYAITDDDSWKNEYYKPLPWSELVPLFSIHRSVSDYLFANREAIGNYDWLYSNPNYGIPFSRIGYWYTYTLKYVYEYTKLFLSVISSNLTSEFFRHDHIRVLSAGCGQGADYTALRHALLLSGHGDTAVVYHGLDALDWNENLPSVLDSLKLPFTSADEEAGASLTLGEDGRIENYLSSLSSCGKEIDADVIIFPTSYLDIVQGHGYDEKRVENLWHSLLNLIKKPTLLIMTTIYNDDTRSAIDKAMNKVDDILCTALVIYSRTVSSSEVADDRLSVFRGAYYLYRLGLKDNISSVINEANSADTDENRIHRMPKLENSSTINFKSFLYVLDGGGEADW